MDKGIRPACNRKFAELLPTRAEIGNTAFRKNVMFHVIEEFGCTLASAATHYNHAFQECKKATPELVEGLGRADDKKGGRKPKAKVVAEAVTLLLGYTAEAAATDVVVTDVVPPAGDAGETAPAQTLFTVKKKSDDSVVAEGLSFEDATALVTKAKAAKKAALYFV